MASPVSVGNNFVGNTPAIADQVDANFNDIITWLNAHAAHLDGSKAFTGAVSLPGAPVTGNHAATKSYVDAATPIGLIAMYAGLAAPAGWLFCHGQNVSRATYSLLFAAIGTSFGNGDGVSTFTLPDFRSRSPIGAGTGSGLSNRALGGTLGTENETAPLPSHFHGLGSHTHTISHDHGIGSLSIVYNGGGGNAQLVAGTGSYGPYNTEPFVPLVGSSGPASGNTDTFGPGGTHNNMHPVLGIHFIIRTNV